jgi:hypothetical protein
MRLLHVAIVLYASIAASYARAQDSLPPPIAAGFAAIRGGDYSRAVDEWTANWANGDSARIRLKANFRNLVEATGKPSGYELVRDVAISPRVHRYYVVLVNEKDPAYLVLEAFRRPNNEWTVERIVFNASLTALSPMDVAAFLTRP